MALREQSQLRAPRSPTELPVLDGYVWVVGGDNKLDSGHPVCPEVVFTDQAGQFSCRVPLKGHQDGGGRVVAAFRAARA